MSGVIERIRPGADAARGDVVLEVSGLCVDYGFTDAVHAVVDAGLTLRRGEVLGLAGESGSGKSTLAYALTRLLRAPGVITAGDVRFHGRDGDYDLLEVDAETMRRLRWSQIAVVFQSAMNALNPVISIGDQITDVLRAHRPGMDRRARRDRAAELLGLVGITSDRLGSFPHELSGGMRQRTMIAMALALEPDVLIMDEPTTALDVVTQREILEELVGLRDRLGFAVLFITHDLSLLIELADTIAVMYAGRVVEYAPAASLFRSPRHPYTAGLLGSFPSLHGARVAMTGIPGSPPDLRHVPSGCPFHPRCPHKMDICEQEPPALTVLHSAGRRAASCWLQTDGFTAPQSLSLPEPTTLGARIVARAGLPGTDLQDPEIEAAGSAL
ncbi:MAG TPA: ABC transporter ATP-binding protein [Actinocrinis sp.]|uniref:ABC transporter ATP-binding protein n=1 Tax=Actinocrinis sp. TaxID=1920516 RepID=UPI002DDCB8AC|nr:ABC transporter ATP-binding protein [Actinocrinis sp.]HEV2343119.1 ABC transporter ATP-binding protein [Actinocrinis sp.]